MGLAVVPLWLALLLSGAPEGEASPPTQAKPSRAKTAAYQMGAGCCAAVACAPLTLCTPAVVGTTVAFTGEVMGARRGTLLWPILTAYGALTTSTLVVGGVFVSYSFATGAAVGQASTYSAPVLLGLLGLGAASVSASVAATVAAYQLFSEPRPAGDDEGWPGWMVPREPAPPVQVASEMRY